MVSNSLSCGGVTDGVILKAAVVYCSLVFGYQHETALELTQTDLCEVSIVLSRHEEEEIRDWLYTWIPWLRALDRTVVALSPQTRCVALKGIRAGLFVIEILRGDGPLDADRRKCRL